MANYISIEQALDSLNSWVKGSQPKGELDFWFCPDLPDGVIPHGILSREVLNLIAERSPCVDYGAGSGRLTAAINAVGQEAIAIDKIPSSDKFTEVRGIKDFRISEYKDHTLLLWWPHEDIYGKDVVKQYTEAGGKCIIYCPGTSPSNDIQDFFDASKKDWEISRYIPGQKDFINSCYVFERKGTNHQKMEAIRAGIYDSRVYHQEEDTGYKSYSPLELLLKLNGDWQKALGLKQLPTLTKEQLTLLAEYEAKTDEKILNELLEHIGDKKTYNYSRQLAQYYHSSQCSKGLKEHTVGSMLNTLNVYCYSIQELTFRELKDNPKLSEESEKIFSFSIQLSKLKYPVIQ